MKKLLARIMGKWFMELSCKHTIYSLYFVISIAGVCSLEFATSWGVAFIALNFINAARLSNHIPFEESSKSRFNTIK